MLLEQFVGLQRGQCRAVGKSWPFGCCFIAPCKIVLSLSHWAIVPSGHFFPRGGPHDGHAVDDHNPSGGRQRAAARGAESAKESNTVTEYCHAIIDHADA